MRRILFTIAASVALIAFVPASAMAKHHKRHHHHHHHHHKRSHARVRTFGHFTKGTINSSSTPSSTSGGAGTVTSFDGTNLVITLNDGTTTETGVVNNDTEIECMASDETVRSDDGGPNGDNSGDNGDQGDQGDQGDDNGNDNGDDNGEDQQENQNCTTADLVMGATVQAAELRITSDGAVWKKIELAS